MYDKGRDGSRYLELSGNVFKKLELLEGCDALRKGLYHLRPSRWIASRHSTLRRHNLRAWVHPPCDQGMLEEMPSALRADGYK